MTNYLVKLLPGESLKVGDSLFSELRGYELILQDDGNLVLYSKGGIPPTPMWATDTVGQQVSILTMQLDGNLVLYRTGGEYVPEGALWSSDTHGNHGALLQLQDDGNLVIYNQNDQPIWATDTQGGRLRDVLRRGQPQN